MDLAVAFGRLADDGHAGDVARITALEPADVDDDRIALGELPLACLVMRKGAVAAAADDPEGRRRAFREKCALTTPASSVSVMPAWIAPKAACMARSAMPALIFSALYSPSSLRMRSAPTVSSVKPRSASGTASRRSSAKSARMVSSSATLPGACVSTASSAAASAACGPSSSLHVWKAMSVSSRVPSAFSAGIRKHSFFGPTSSRQGRSSGCG
jgi:hypothetical protein